MNLCVTCQYVRVASHSDRCAECAKHFRTSNFVENSIKDFLLRDDKLKHFTYSDETLPCSENKERPDITYVLDDRIVVLEIDENEHRYNNAECETRREQRMVDVASENGKILIVVRCNPNPKGKDATFKTVFENLRKKLLEAFKTEDYKFCEDGVYRMYLGYTGQRKRGLDACMRQDQSFHYKKLQDDAFSKSDMSDTRDIVQATNNAEISDTDVPPSIDRKKRVVEEIIYLRERLKLLRVELSMINEEESRQDTKKIAIEATDIRERETVCEPSEDLFFAALAKEIYDKSFTEKFLKSKVPVANGIYAFDWSALAQNECYYETSKSLYEKYKRQKGDGCIMSVNSFSRRLIEMGLFKAQKRVKDEKKTDVVWVGFKRKESTPLLTPSFSKDEDTERCKRPRLGDHIASSVSPV